MANFLNSINAEKFNLSLPPPNVQLASIIKILEPATGQTNWSALTKEKIIFCYKVVIQTLIAYNNAIFTEFDALTATTCCHGLSILVQKCLKQISSIPLQEIVSSLQSQLFDTELNFSDEKKIRLANYFLPEPIIRLSQMYILSFIKTQDLERGGWRTVTTKLKEIAPLGSKFYSELVKHLQTEISNEVADSYYSLVKILDTNISINQVPIQTWGKYLNPIHIRLDRRGRKYAPCLYSMQLTLAYLIQSRSKIALIHDLRSHSGVYQGRYLEILEGDGHSNFTVYNIGSTPNTDLYSQEPIIVLSGCTYSDKPCLESLKFQLNPWLSRLPSLILGCDTYYPQFPAVRDDPDFDNSPIIPEEKELKDVIEMHRQISGVSSKDSSLFCLTHIYTASFKQIARIASGDHAALHESYIPKILLDPLDKESVDLD